VAVTQWGLRLLITERLSVLFLFFRKLYPTDSDPYTNKPYQVTILILTAHLHDSYCGLNLSCDLDIDLDVIFIDT
jgi:hypothetical protein